MTIAPVSPKRTLKYIRLQYLIFQTGNSKLKGVISLKKITDRIYLGLISGAVGLVALTLTDFLSK